MKIEKYEGYDIAAKLIKRIIAPSNQVADSEVIDSVQGSESDRTHSVYNISFFPSFAGDGNPHYTLNQQYNSLIPYKPDDYRIGGTNEFQRDINELIRLIVYKDIDLDELPIRKIATKDEIDKALTVSNVFSGVAESEIYFYNIFAQKYRFPQDVWSKISGSNGLAEYDSRQAETILEEILNTQRMLLTRSGSFNQGTYSFKHTIDDLWFFERFLKTVNGEDATGIHSGNGFSYKKFSPSMPEYAGKGITINGFPGPGLVIHGFHSPMFPKDYLSKRFSLDKLKPNDSTIITINSSKYDYKAFINWVWGKLSRREKNTPDLQPPKDQESITDKIDAEYREYLVKGDRYLSKTIFAPFRGGYLIYNPIMMMINGNSYGLFVNNDHFPHGHVKTASLIRGKYVDKFINNPFQTINEANIFHPTQISELIDSINLVSLAAQAGFCEEVPIEDKSLGRRLSLHNEIKNAVLFGFSQLDLIREAFRLFSLGYCYNKEKNNFYLDEFVLLKELLRINKHASTKIDEKTESLPVAFPFTFLDQSIDPKQVLQSGFVGANMVVHKKNHKGGDCLLFGDKLSSIEPASINDLSEEDIRKMLGKEERNYWSGFREGCEYSGANPVIVDPIYKDIGVRIIAAGNK